MNELRRQNSPQAGGLHTANHNSPIDSEETTCPRCNESRELAKVKGCIKCLKCGYKFDCNGW